MGQLLLSFALPCLFAASTAYEGPYPDYLLVVQPTWLVLAGGPKSESLLFGLNPDAAQGCARLFAANGSFVALDDCEGKLQGKVSLGGALSNITFYPNLAQDDAGEPAAESLDALLAASEARLRLTPMEIELKSDEGDGGAEEHRRRKREAMHEDYEAWAPLCPYVPRTGALRSEVPVNVAVVIDPLAVAHFGGDAAKAEAKVRQIVAEADAYYQLRSMPIPYKLRIALLEVLTEEVEEAKVGGLYDWSVLLSSKLASDVLRNNASIHHVAFFVGADPDSQVVESSSGTRGKARVQEMCTDRSVSMTRVNLVGGDPVAATFAHEIGHTLGMNHDGDNGPACNKYPTQMMGPSGSMPIAAWSPCSVQQAERWFGCFTCLHGDPISNCVDEERNCAYQKSAQCTMGNLAGGPRRSETVTGKACQAWAAQEPHKHSFPGNSHFGNECRNSNDEMPWCYTTDPDKRWEYCYEACPDSPKFTVPEPPKQADSCVDEEKDCAHYTSMKCRVNDGLPTKNVTKAGLGCQAWSAQEPHSHSWGENAQYGSNCAATPSDKSPWCYTVDPDKRWDFCWEACEE